MVDICSHRTKMYKRVLSGFPEFIFINAQLNNKFIFLNVNKSPLKYLLTDLNFSRLSS